jgi:hypothetical protein
MPELRAAVYAHQGITLALEQEDDGGAKATVMRSRNNELKSLFSGRSSVAQALARAKSLSLTNGFDGYYEIKEPEEWGAPSRADLKGALDEITRQIDALLPRAGVGWGFSGPLLSPRQLAEIDPVRAQITRLTNLRDSLFSSR